MKQLSCDQCRERWDELINNSTFEASAEVADVRAHLEICADCRKTFHLLIAARQELQQIPMQKAPDSLRVNILRQIEKPQQQSIPWWNSLFMPQQRLVWASGAIVAIFVVALLMRPEYQTQVLPPVPTGIFNRGQVQEHNDTLSPPSPPQADSTNVSPEKGKTQEKPIITPNAKLSTPKSQRPPSIESGSVRRSKPHQAQIASAPEPALGSDKPSPERLKVQSLQKAKSQKSATPQVQRSAAPTPINNDSVTNEQSAKDAAGAVSPPPSFAIQSDSDKRPMMRSTPEPEGRGGAKTVLKAQSARQVIHWSNTITSDYDVTNAKITATLEDGLTFADESHKDVDRTLWQGTLFRGKQIPLDINLHRTSNETAKIHVKMINANTQKVLLDKTFDVK